MRLRRYTSPLFIFQKLHKYGFTFQTFTLSFRSTQISHKLICTLNTISRLKKRLMAYKTKLETAFDHFRNFPFDIHAIISHRTAHFRFISLIMTMVSGGYTMTRRLELFKKTKYLKWPPSLHVTYFTLMYATG